MTARDSTKFNIVVPTRERPDTLYHCLRTILSQNYSNFEVIVSDNFSQDNTEEVVKSFGDQRIRYVNTGRRISMSHNFEFAISQVNDGWVTTLGDDDGLLPGALARIDEIICQAGGEFVISPWCSYVWPSLPEYKSRLILPLTEGWEVRNSAAWLSRLMRGMAHYSDLPMLYTGGFAKKTAIDRARGRDNKFYHSLNPDMYSAIALASVLENYIYLKEPVAIAGISAHSNGASCLGISGKTEPAAKFLSENNIEFHPSLDGQPVKSIPLFVYESYLQSSFLHHDFLQLKLSDQLAMALALADKEWRNELLEYCTRVAIKNAVDINDVTKMANVLESRFAARKRFLNYKTSILDLFRRTAIAANAHDLGANNVFEASLVARSLRAGMVDNKKWRRKKIIAAIRRRISTNTPVTSDSKRETP